jgi:hypothetical protein
MNLRDQKVLPGPTWNALDIAWTLNLRICHIDKIKSRKPLHEASWWYDLTCDPVHASTSQRILKSTATAMTQLQFFSAPRLEELEFSALSHSTLSCQTGHFPILHKVNNLKGFCTSWLTLYPPSRGRGRGCGRGWWNWCHVSPSWP